MADYLFIGRVLPEKSDITISEPPLIVGAEEITSQAKFEAAISIKHSQISAEVNVKSGSIATLSLRNTVRNLIRTIIDSIGFAHTLALDIELDTVIDVNGNHTVYDTSIDLRLLTKQTISDTKLSDWRWITVSCKERWLTSARLS
jgi:hypothetical protein